MGPSLSLGRDGRDIVVLLGAGRTREKEMEREESPRRCKRQKQEVHMPGSA